MSQTWFITGASSGLGQALAEAVIARGDRVCVTARDASRLNFQNASDDQVLRLALDLNAPQSLRRAMDTATAHFGQIDILVNNAGYGILGAIEETSDDEVRALFETNFFGLAALTKAVLPAMRARKSGWIINFTSVSGVTGSPGSGFYAASKFAVEGFSDALRQEMAEFGVTVMIIEPGAFRTDFFGRSRVHTKLHIPTYTTVEKRRASPHESFGQQPGDPKAAAKVILEAMAMTPPPERLQLGQGASTFIGKVLKKRLAEVESQTDLARAADFPA